MRIHFYLYLSLFIIFNPISLLAQTYCTPTFTNGCTSSNYIAQVTFAGISNTQTGCTVSNFTAMTAYVNAGVDSFMTVTNAGWDGVGVYVDLNKDGSFTVDEKFFSQYKANTPPITYANIPIRIPLYIRSGTYRLRILVGNGYGWPNGGCGSTAYGNYHDYTLNVTNNNPALNNAGVSRKIAPVNFCPDSQDIIVEVKNLGLNAITHLEVNWTLDSILQTPVAYNSLIDTFGSVNGNAANVTLGRALFGSATRKIYAWTSNPNYITDTINYDDTLSNVSLRASLNGIYTIGGTSPSFATIVEATTALNAVGICGPVVFNIRPGTYNEKLVINNYPGGSDSVRVIFQSEGNSKSLVTISAASTSNTDGVVKFNGCSYVTIKDLTINQTGTTASSCVVVGGTAIKDSLVNCTISTAATTTSGTYSFYTASAGLDRFVLKNNLITGGYYGLYFTGASTTSLNTNCIIDSNTISGAYYYTVYGYYTSNLKFRFNFVATNTASATHYLATFGYCDNALEVGYNKISGAGITSTLYGLRIYYSDGTVGQPGLIHNNALYFQTSGTLYGLYSYYSSNQSYYHNSIYGNSSGATNYPVYLYHTSAVYGNILFRNNIFSNFGTTGYAVYIYTPDFINSDYNLYYSNGAGLIYKALATATAYTNLNQYRTAFPTQESNSIVYRPAFTSTSNLSINSSDTAAWAMNGRAIHQTLFNRDLSGTMRPTRAINGAADIGAYEFTPVSLAPKAIAVPAVPTAGTVQSFLFANDTIAQIVWDASTTAPTYVNLRYYTGEKPPFTNSASSVMRAYWDFDAPAGYYNFELKLRYIDSLMGNLPVESDMKLARYDPTTGWLALTGSASICNTATNINSTPALSQLGLFTLTDNNNPLPVELGVFTANYTEPSARIDWTTLSETNTRSFEIQRSTDGIKFEEIGSVKASGNSKTIKTYAYLDHEAGSLIQEQFTLYYRLRMVDLDGKITYSKVVSIEPDNRDLQVKLFPNPYHSDLTISMGPINSESTIITLTDLMGRTIFSFEPSRETSIHIRDNRFNEIPGGIYLLSVQTSKSIKSIKLIKD